MTAIDSKAMAPPVPAPRPPGLTRRRFLGGALTAALAAVLPIRDTPVKPAPNRWHGKTRWIGHA